MEFDMQPIITLISIVNGCIVLMFFFCMNVVSLYFCKEEFPVRTFYMISLIIAIVGSMLCYIVNEGLHVSP